ncbi:MAG: cbb3-type cytochrome c oxidase N-terminal domain-containing protein [Bacteroidia bacterium]
MKKSIIYPLISIAILFLLMGNANAQELANEAVNSTDSDWSFETYLPWILLVTAAALAIVILFMGSLLSRVAILKAKKSLKNVTAVLLALPGYDLLAATSDAGSTWFTTNVLNYTLLGVIFFEVLIILYFANWLKAVVLPKRSQEEKRAAIWAKWWKQANKSVDIENEGDVQLDHDYDGIKELDNALPPWWVYGFYLTIVFSLIYVWRYHISGTAPLQVEELNISIAEAKIRQAEYDKNNANKVDENSIVYEANPTLIANGEKLFAKNCVACHAADGGGGTGPNLTDKYWKHGGSINDIFKIIRLGVPDMGMIAWGEQLTPIEIAGLANYVMSIQGTKPANPKSPEGEIYNADGANTEEDMESDSANSQKTLAYLNN